MHEIIQVIQRLLDQPFYMEWGFWIGVINIFILTATLYYLKIYTSATKDTFDEIKKQTEIHQMPILMLHIRSVDDYKTFTTNPEETNHIMAKYSKYRLTVKDSTNTSKLFLSLENVGQGSAYNVELQSDVFEVREYEGQFFTPLHDEHPIAINRKNGINLNEFEELNNKLFTIICKNVKNKEYHYKFKIIDINERKIEYLGNC